MAQPQRKHTMDELESAYNELTSLYDYAGELVETVESKFVSDPEAQLALIEPLVNEVGDAVDMLTEEYLSLADAARRKTIGASSKTRIETALRRIYVAVNEYRERVRDVTKQAHQAITNIADPIVNKIQRQVERVIVIFLDFVQLSLSSIMNKGEMDQLRQREARVALMLHQMSQQQS